MAYENIDLEALLAEWQPLLRLSHWYITVGYERRLGANGTCTYNTHSLRAAIKLIDPLDYQDTLGGGVGPDPEQWLVHELCHLHLAALDVDTDSPKHLHVEQAVQSLSRALVALKRQKLAAPLVPATKARSR